MLTEHNRPFATEGFLTIATPTFSIINLSENSQGFTRFWTEINK